MTKRLIGLFGGTFDPVHVGHLRAALELRELVGVDELRFIPSGLPPHRDPPVASGAARAGMLEAALSDAPGCIVDRCEIERPGVSYTVDTLVTMRKADPHASHCLMLGHDAWCALTSWTRWQDVLGLAHIVVANRPGSEESAPPELEALRADREAISPAALRESTQGAILFCEVTQMELSSSRIRAFASAGRSLRFLVPDAVWAVIEREGYYRKP